MTKKKSEKQSEYLAVGEFDVGQVINIARASFLWTIQQKEPRVSLQLREEVLNTFPVTKLHIDAPVPSVAKQRWKRLIEGTIECQDIASFRKDFQSGLFDNDEPFFVFLKALFDWSKYWNLDADWFVLRALKTLNSWTKNKILRESLQWSRLLYGMDDPENEPQPPKGFPAWNVLDESAKTYRLKVTNQARNRIIKDEILSQVEASHREHFIRKLDPVVKDYQDQVSQFYKALGYKPINRYELLKHIEWTVAFQVSRESFINIASSADVERQAVSKAVKSVLRLIGLTQRLTKGGRPLGSKDSGFRHTVSRKTRR